MYPGGRNVGEYEVALDFGRLQHVVEQVPDARQSSRARSRRLTKDLTFRTAMYSKKLNMPCSRQQSAELGGDLFDEMHGKIVKRQARNDEVVGPIFGQLFHAGVNQLDPPGDRLEGFVAGNPIAETGHELVVALDQREAIRRTHMANDMGGDGARAGTDFEDRRDVELPVSTEVVPLRRPSANVACERVAQGPAAWQHSTCRVKRAAKFPPENPIVGPLLLHSSILRASHLGRQADKSSSANFGQRRFARHRPATDKISQ